MNAKQHGCKQHDRLATTLSLIDSFIVNNCIPELLIVADNKHDILYMDQKQKKCVDYPIK